MLRARAVISYIRVRFLVPRSFLLYFILRRRRRSNRICHKSSSAAAAATREHVRKGEDWHESMGSRSRGTVRRASPCKWSYRGDEASERVRVFYTREHEIARWFILAFMHHAVLIFFFLSNTQSFSTYSFN